MTPADLTAVLSALARELAPHIARELGALAPSAGSRDVVAPLVDKREVGRLLGVSVAKVDWLVRSGLPYVPVGDVKRFDIEACRAWLAAAGKNPVTKQPVVRRAPPVGDGDAGDATQVSGVRLLSRRRGGMTAIT